jgi:site-specific recombinase XerD
LEAAKRSERTIQAYTEAAELLAAFRPGVDFEDLTRADLTAFFADYGRRHRASSAAVRFRSLRRFFGWMVAEEIIEVSPMARLAMPKVPRNPVPVLGDDQIERLLKVTSGKGFEQRRDHAVLRVWLDTGIRLGEMAGLRLADVDLTPRRSRLRVTGKGDKTRIVPVGAKTALALDRYLNRDRVKHPQAELPELWIGARAQGMTESGITQMLRRRAAEAGIDHLHPHMFRHTFAHEWRRSGGDDDSLMMIMGWDSRAMLHIYAASTSAERAAEAHRRLSPGDRW